MSTPLGGFSEHVSKVVYHATRQFMREVADRFTLPDIYWTYDGSVLTGYTGADWSDSTTEWVVRRWAAALGLSDPSGAAIGPGAVQAEGDVGGVRVQVWGVTDRAVWERTGKETQ